MHSLSFNLQNLYEPEFISNSFPRILKNRNDEENNLSATKMYECYLRLLLERYLIERGIIIFTLQKGYKDCLDMIKPNYGQNW